MNILKMIIEEVENFDYRGHHTAPNSEGGVPLYDVEDYLPDIYTRGYKLYGYGKSYNIEAIKIIQSVKGKPDALVKIYRAVPNMNDGNSLDINERDWVTIVLEYANIHGKSNLKNDYNIVTKTVKAKELYTDGNDVCEWGYDPN